jgi:hypothetical protein
MQPVIHCVPNTPMICSQPSLPFAARTKGGWATNLDSRQHCDVSFYPRMESLPSTVYDPNFPDTINLTTTRGAVHDALIATARLAQ